jgi:hypothetical protein
MRWLTIVVAVVVLTGCSTSGDDAATGTSQTTTEVTPDSVPEAPPRTYRELMARLPPFDEPASPEVSAYRKAAVGGFIARCATGRGSADERAFVAANRRVFALAGLVPGARLVSETSVDQRDGNGCLEGTGPASYYTTARTYRLPAGTTVAAVFAHYERTLQGWLETSGSTPCDRRFSQGPAYLGVDVCKGRMRLTALGQAPLEPPSPSDLPPRPFGAQYPLAQDYGSVPEPTSDETKPGATCERIAGADVPSIIVPPPPGITATIDDEQYRVGSATYPGSIVVDWSLGTVHGDCPPAELVVSYPTLTAFTVHEPVHAGSGVTRIPLVGLGPRPTLLRAAAVSVDGPRSRQVAVRLR